MRDSARECPASLGDSQIFGTKARNVAVSVVPETVRGIREVSHLGAKGEIGAWS